MSRDADGGDPRDADGAAAGHDRDPWRRDAHGAAPGTGPAAPEVGGPPAGDSAGVPWEGRSFEANRHADDDGRADPALAAALAAVRSGGGTAVGVVEALRSARVLVPLVAEDGGEPRDADAGAAGPRRAEKSQELSIVTLEGPDARPVLPAFTDVAALARWRPSARPVPVDGRRLAAAALGEGTDLVVLDPGSSGVFTVRRPAIWAVARGEAWLPSHDDPEVLAAFRASIGTELAVLGLSLAAGDPAGTGETPELVVVLSLAAGLTAGELDAVLSRLATRWAADDVIATRVDSLTVRLVADGA